MRIAFVIATFATMSLAGAGSATETAKPTSAVAPADKLVCKSEQRTGTRFRTKICKTAAQWEEQSEQARRDAHDQIDTPKPNMATER